MKRENFGSGAPWEAVVGYSRAVRAGRRIVVTGTVGEGKDAYAQAADALAKIAAVLARAGGTMADVVRTRIFVTDIARDWEAVGRAHREALGDVMPATTMVQVAALIAPQYLVEIEADAELGQRPGPAPEPADYNDDAVADLLSAAGLPIPGDEDAPVQMRVLRENGRPLACAGFERHGDFALLRSVAVDAAARGRGLGSALVSGVLDELARAGVAAVCLLTLDAAPFFTRLGFAPIARDAVPAPLLASREFVLHHCDRAESLVREL